MRALSRHIKFNFCLLGPFLISDFSMFLPSILHILKVCEIKLQRGVMCAWRTRPGLGPQGCLLDAEIFTTKFVEDFWANFCAFWGLLVRAKGKRKASCCC